MNYGDLPIDLGKFPVKWQENCFYLYLPIKMPGDWEKAQLRIPERLLPLRPLVERTYGRAWDLFYDSVDGNRTTKNKNYQNRWVNSYLYLTVKHMLVHPGAWGNRGGAHCDGFGTDDVNWAWYDKNPTEFCAANFKDISDDHAVSMKQFEEQWDHRKVVTYPEQHLLELSPFVVHRVARVTKYDMRTFVKISLSKHKFNLVGNSHNYLFDYKWEMHDRSEVRNLERYKDYKNADFVPAMLK